VAPADPQAISIEGQVLDGARAPIDDAMIELWQANREGRYAHPEDAHEHASRHPGFSGFGRCCTDAQGRFSFVTVKPGPVPGLDGRLQAPHIEVSVFARGLLKRLVTRIYFPDERAANEQDEALRSIEDPRARATLIAAEDGRGRLRFDIHLQGDDETAFFAV
jgi:protocatechuate 3,4-dioxygenase alpha subunit